MLFFTEIRAYSCHIAAETPHKCNLKGSATCSRGSSSAGPVMPWGQIPIVAKWISSILVQGQSSNTISQPYKHALAGVITYILIADCRNVYPWMSVREFTCSSHVFDVERQSAVISRAAAANRNKLVWPYSTNTSGMRRIKIVFEDLITQVVGPPAGKWSGDRSLTRICLHQPQCEQVWQSRLQWVPNPLVV